MRKSVFLCGAGLLCLASWIDNVRGPMLPALTSYMNIDQQSAGFMISLGNLVAMISTWALMPLLNKWSLRRVGSGALFYTSIATAASMFVSDRTSLFIWGALIGGSISTLGSLSNLFVQSGIDPRRRGQMMSVLHSLYGLSSLFAPWVAGKILVNPSDWQLLFVSASPLALLFAGIVLRYGDGSQTAEGGAKARRQPIAIDGIHILTISVLIAYVLGEVLTSTWMTSFLTSEAGLSIEVASRYTSAFFAAMLGTRVLCGLWAPPRYHRAMIWICLIVAFSCFVGGRLTGQYWLLPLAGLIGPFFPLYVTWTSVRFPERDRTLVIWMLSGMQAALAVMNTLVGQLADSYGFKTAFWTPAVMFIITMALLKSLETAEQSNH